VLLGDPSKIKSVRGIWYDRKTLMSFYKDREEEEEGEEVVDAKEEEKEFVFV
jgi:hypothetical protein